MQLPLDGFWQISPLTDLSVPQNDLTFPALLSDALPAELSEPAIAEQEWHLMHDFYVDEDMLAQPCALLVFAGIHQFAEVRINGNAVMDCDGTQARFSKDILQHLQLGHNRVELLFLEQEEEWLLEEQVAPQCSLEPEQVKETRLGVFECPYIQFICHVRLTQVATEQIWHHGGGCEFKVDLYFETYKPGLISAKVAFNGMAYHVPIDMRANQASALFQIEAPICADLSSANQQTSYPLKVTLDGQEVKVDVLLNPQLCARHIPL